MKFDPSKPVQTRDGRAVRILCTDLKYPGFPIAAALHDRDEDDDVETVELFTADGCYLESGVKQRLDLVNVPETHTKWANIYPPEPPYHPTHTRILHDTKDQAFRNAGPNRIACVLIKYTEGEGLD